MLKEQEISNVDKQTITQWEMLARLLQKKVITQKEYNLKIERLWLI